MVQKEFLERLQMDGTMLFLSFLSPYFGGDAKVIQFSLMALLFTIVVMFSLKGGKVVSLSMEVLRIAIPLTIYFVVMFFIRFFMRKWMGNNYARTTAILLIYAQGQ